MKHFGGLEEKTMSYLRTYLFLRGGGREGEDVCGDGSHAVYRQQKQRLAHGW